MFHTRSLIEGKLGPAQPHWNPLLLLIKFQSVLWLTHFFSHSRIPLCFQALPYSFCHHMTSLTSAYYPEFRVITDSTLVIRLWQVPICSILPIQKEKKKVFMQIWHLLLNIFIFGVCVRGWVIQLLKSWTSRADVPELCPVYLLKLIWPFCTLGKLSLHHALSFTLAKTRVKQNVKLDFLKVLLEHLSNGVKNLVMHIPYATVYLLSF